MTTKQSAKKAPAKKAAAKKATPKKAVAKKATAKKPPLKVENTAGKRFEDLEAEQVATGRTPLRPGPEKDIDPEVAQAAKENRGRGLG